MKKTTIAFMYDFDKTLSPKDMQEYSFIPSIGMDSKEFWSKADDLSKNANMDSILAYMYNMIKYARRNNVSIKRESFMALGKDVKLYKGVSTWFKRVNAYGKKLGLNIEHYIISSGLAEIIEGTSIAKYFKKIFACEFLYSLTTGDAIWPKQAINYTTKTQFLFRISKGIIEAQDDNKLNTKMKENERAIPYRNMIYFGDGLTDVPCMKLIKSYGGYSIAIYEKSFNKAKKLIEDQRVNFVCKADYSQGSELETIVERILDNMATTNAIEEIYDVQEQARNSNYMSELKALEDETK